MKQLVIMLIGFVKTGFRSFSASTLVTKAKKGYNAIVNNANFPTPIPDLATILSLIAALESAITAAENGDRVAIKLRNQARINLALAMTSLANYVNFTSNGSQEIAATSGLDLYKTKEAIVVQPIKRLKVVTEPNTNSIKLTAVGGRGARSFMHQYTPDLKMAEGSWISVNCTTRTCTISNLVANTPYALRVIGIGSKGQTVISDPVTRVVQ